MRTWIWIGTLALATAACGHARERDRADASSADAAASDGAASVDETATRVARAGTVVGSCWPDDGIPRNVDYMWHTSLIQRLWGRTVLQSECLATTTRGCRALEDCFGFTVQPAPVGCENRCDGDVFTGCGDGGLYTFDCASVGWSCDLDAACVPGPTTACDRTTYEPSCSADGEPLFCDGAVWTGPRCADLGLVCDELGGCRGTGEPCSGGSLSYEGRIDLAGLGCSGSALQACVGGQRHLFDCRTLGAGFDCHEWVGSDGTADFFCGLSDECSPRFDGAECADAASIELCNAGRVDRVDCTSLGFTGCGTSRWSGDPGCVE
jgi:hypothetical protein